MESLENIYKLYKKSSGVSIDTRTMSDNALFFAIRGDRFDGNAYALQALESGAIAAVVDDREIAKRDARLLLVEDSLSTLQYLGNHHRRQTKAWYVGITGSNGKTTTKELVYSVLSQKFRTAVTQGNFNNHIGVPLTLLEVPDDAELAIIEMGANAQEEIAFLAEIAEPDAGLITNIGLAHLEGFGGVEGIRKGKSELYRFLEKRNGLIFYNMDESSLVGLVDLNWTGLRKYSLTAGPWQDYDVVLKAELPTLQLEIRHGKDRYPLATNLFGTYNLGNVSTAIGLGRFHGIGWEDIIKGIESYVPENNRSQIVKQGTNTYIFDAYNANPTSMKAAISAFARTSYETKVLILGEMLELGEWSVQEHQELLAFIKNGLWNHVYLIGKEFASCMIYDDMEYYATPDEFIQSFTDLEWEQAGILVKGSRRVGLEKLLDHLS